MRINQNKLASELTAAEVKKGDVVVLVGAWNHFIGGPRDPKRGKVYTEDVYYYETWTVAAIGKKLMRLVRPDGLTKKQNIHLSTRADGAICFREFITRPGQVGEIVDQIRATDEKVFPSFRYLSKADLCKELY